MFNRKNFNLYNFDSFAAKFALETFHRLFNCTIMFNVGEICNKKSNSLFLEAVLVDTARVKNFGFYKKKRIFAISTSSQKNAAE